MAREILFRGLSKHTGQWVHGDYCSIPSPNILFYNSENEADVEEVIPESVGQYTGIKTKNGIRIFENDILICSEYDSSDTVKMVVQTFKNALVHFTQGSFYYCPNCNINQPHQLLMYAHNASVIGNTTQNPKLLK